MTEIPQLLNTTGRTFGNSSLLNQTTFDPFDGRTLGNNTRFNRTTFDPFNDSVPWTTGEAREDSEDRMKFTTLHLLFFLVGPFLICILYLFKVLRKRWKNM